MSTTKQRQEIGYMRKLIGLDEEIYREMLSDFNNASSSKDLSDTEARTLLNSLRDKAKEMGVFKPVKQFAFQKHKYSNLVDRYGMASPAQLRKIEAMWFRVSRQDNDTDRAEALRIFSKKITGKDHLKFLTSEDVRKVIKALEAMTIQQLTKGEQLCQTK